MDLLQIGAQLIQSKLGENLDLDTVKNALTSLVGGEGGNIDIAGLAQSFMSNGGLQSAVTSWLGDGGNDSISASQVVDILGSDKVSGFASALGLGEADAAEGLSDVLPQLVDKASSGGDLLDSVGGVSGLASLAKSFF
jgi:uncharacterized protein YidB (DUF937 family)